MSEIWVVNASPVIALAAVDHLHLLTELSTEVLQMTVAINRAVVAVQTPRDAAAQQRLLEGILEAGGILRQVAQDR